MSVLGSLPMGLSPVLAASDAIEAFGQPEYGSMGTWLGLAAALGGVLVFTAWNLWVSREPKVPPR